MGSNIGGFVNGFVKQVNRNTEAAKMAEYEQFIYNRKRQDELEDWRADNKALIDAAKIETQAQIDAAKIKTQAQTDRDTALFAANEAAAKLENDNKLVAITDAEKKEIAQLTETLIALNPEFANDPEALAMALKSGTDGLYLYTNSQFRYQPNGSLMSAKDIVDRDTREYVMASAPVSWRDNPAWMNTEAAIEFAERVRSEGGRSGLATLHDAGMSFENILDEEGAVIGSRIARAQDQGEPWKVEQIEINTARDHIMSHLSNIPGLTGIDMIDGNFRVDNPALFSGIDTMVQNTIRRYAELKTTQEGQYALVTQVANQILSEQLEGFLGYAKAANTLGFIADGREVSLEDKMESLAYLRGVEDHLGVQAVLGSMTPEEQGKWRSSLVSTNVEGDVDVPDAETTGEEVVDQGFTIEEVPTGTGLSAQTRKIYTLDEVGLNKMREAYELHASQSPPARRQAALIPIEQYVATKFGFSRLNPLDREAINQLIKQFETAEGPAAPAIIENDAVRD